MQKKTHKYIIHCENSFYFTNEYKVENNCIKFDNHLICGNYEIEDLKKR